MPASGITGYAGDALGDAPGASPIPPVQEPPWERQINLTDDAPLPSHMGPDHPERRSRFAAAHEKLVKSRDGKKHVCIYTDAAAEQPSPEEPGSPLRTSIAWVDTTALEVDACALPPGVGVKGAELEAILRAAIHAEERHSVGTKHLTKGTAVGYVEEIQDSAAIAVISEDASPTHHKTTTPSELDIDPSLPGPQRRQLTDLLAEFSECFATSSKARGSACSTDATIVPRLWLARPEALHLADAAIVPRHRLARRNQFCGVREAEARGLVGDSPVTLAEKALLETLLRYSCQQIDYSDKEREALLRVNERMAGKITSMHITIHGLEDASRRSAIAASEANKVAEKGKALAEEMGAYLLEEEEKHRQAPEKMWQEFEEKLHLSNEAPLVEQERATKVTEDEAALTLYKRLLPSMKQKVLQRKAEAQERVDMLQKAIEESKDDLEQCKKKKATFGRLRKAQGAAGRCRKGSHHPSGDVKQPEVRF
ncbi:uncharacterized protein ISCGN_010450 [Ixodes scapularis]